MNWHEFNWFLSQTSRTSSTQVRALRAVISRGYQQWKTKQETAESRKEKT